jgi:CBS-domain-containing membrane protein
MPQTVIRNTSFRALKDSDSVGEAVQGMLDDRVSDLPVVDGEGRLIGLFKLDLLLASLLPKAALIGYGVPDLAFISDTVTQLRERMREIETEHVRHFAVKPDHVVRPDTSPMEVVMLLYKGANNVPVVDRETGKLVGMVDARDVLAALQAKEG